MGTSVDTAVPDMLIWGMDAGKHKGKRARVLGPAKKKYRVQVWRSARELLSGAVLSRNLTLSDTLSVTLSDIQ